jgi:hypothetical protein
LTRKALLNIERSHDQAADNLEAETDDIRGGISDAQDKILSCPACRKTFHTAQKMDDHLACASHSNEVERLLRLPHAVHRLSKTEIEWLSRNHKNGDRQPQTPPRSNSFNLRTFDKVEAGIETRASNLQLSLQGDTQAFSEELDAMPIDATREYHAHAPSIDILLKGYTGYKPLQPDSKDETLSRDISHGIPIWRCGGALTASCVAVNESCILIGKAG